MLITVLIHTWIGFYLFSFYVYFLNKSNNSIFFCYSDTHDSFGTAIVNFMTDGPIVTKPGATPTPARKRNIRMRYSIFDFIAFLSLSLSL